MKQNKNKMKIPVLLASFLLTFAFLVGSLADAENPVAQTVQTVLAPVQKRLTGTAEHCKECEAFTIKQNETQWIAEENRAMREMLHLSPKNVSFVHGEIFAYGTDLPCRTLWIDKGTQNGIQPNDPVVFCGTLLGRVTHAEPNRSQVSFITAPGTAFGAVIAETGDKGVVTCETVKTKTVLTLSFLQDTATPKTGQKVETSGIGNCPAGCLIGTVSEVVSTETGGFRVTVLPAADFSNLSFVTVITV